MARGGRKKVLLGGNENGENIYDVGLYLRLSDKDEGGRQSISESIENQRRYLLDYFSDKPCMHLKSTYIDDGKTGTNFDRSGFQQLMEDIRKRSINCVAVKDLSRLGRNFYEMGELLEIIFPFYSVRLIAPADNFDSEEAGFSDLSFHVPITNFVNETYVKDTSKKIRTARLSMARRGKISYSNVPYGYQKSSADKYSLEVDREAAEAVKMIYDSFEKGISKVRIAKELNEKGILSPSQYKRLKGNKTPYPENSRWTDSMVRFILCNPVYRGAAVYGRTRTVQPRGKKIPVSEENWIFAEDANPAIITAEQFWRVQKLLERGRASCRKKKDVPQQRKIKTVLRKTY